MHVTVVKPARKGDAKALGAFELPDAATVADLKQTFAAKTRISRHRVSFKLPAANSALVVRLRLCAAPPLHSHTNIRARLSRLQTTARASRPTA